MKPRVLLALAILLVAALGGVVALRHRHARMDMVARLAELAAREGVWDNPWDKTTDKIAELRQALTTERDPRNRFTLEREIAAQAVYAGDVDQAISTLEDLQRELGTSMPPDAAEAVKADLAFAQLRRGETENCAEHHTPASCIFPIGREGVHQLKRGSSRAVELYRELLSDPATNPENALSYRWLMNIGHMTLGTYPDGVPAKWLIPPEAFRSDADIGRFPDVAASRGVVEFGAAGGLILEDLDNDGSLDMLISHMGMTDQLEYFHNDGNGHFTRRTEEGGTEGSGRGSGHVPGRLRQRRLHRRLHSAWRVATRRGEDSGFAAPQQLQRDIHRRHVSCGPRNRAARRRRLPGRTSTTTGASTCSSATRSAPRWSGRREPSTSSST